MAFDNKLSDSDEEVLKMLAEEASEVIKEIMKIMRHGYESFHPANPSVTNRELLEKEVGDFLGILEQLELRGHVQPDNIAFHKQEKWKNALPYTHYQEIPLDD